MDEDRNLRFSSPQDESADDDFQSSSFSSSRRNARSSGAANVNNHQQNSLVWNLFQDAAANTSRLYQARTAGKDGHWTNFQNAAGSISMLYKESLDAQQRSFDAGFRSGVEKAYNELMDWLVQDPRFHRCKTVRMEDLVNFIYSPRNPATMESKVRKKPENPSHSTATHVASGEHAARELETFRDALHVSSLSGAMSHFSVNRSPPRSSPSRTRAVDLHAFVTEEIRRHKRTTKDAFDSDHDEDFSEAFKRARFSPAK